MEQSTTLQSVGHFLGLFVARRNTSKTTSYHWSEGQPSPSTYTPLYSPYWPYTPCTNPTSHFPCVRRLPVHTPFPPFSLSSTRLAVPAFPSFFPSFPPRPSIHAVSTPSVLSRLSCRDEWPRCPPGTCCFINMADSFGVCCVAWATV